jgi:hypothetical protein
MGIEAERSRAARRKGAPPENMALDEADAIRERMQAVLSE